MSQHSDLREHSLRKSILNQMKEDAVLEKLLYFHLCSCAPSLNEPWCRCVGNALSGTQGFGLLCCICFKIQVTPWRWEE